MKPVSSASPPCSAPMKCGPTSATSPVRFYFLRCFALGASSLAVSDPALRLMGFIVGLLLLGAVWLNGWFFHRSTPLVALRLLAVNASVVRWGDSLRAYGLARLLMLMALAMAGVSLRSRG